MVWDDGEYQKFALKFARVYGVCKAEKLDSDMKELMNKYGVSNEDAGKINAIYTNITIKGLPYGIQKSLANMGKNRRC